MGLVYPLPSQNASLGGKVIDLESCLGKTVLVVGGGGREHAIVDALSRSPQVSKIYCAPGNAGIGLKAFNVPLKDTDVEGLKNFALENAVDLTVVGPEAALAAGLTDAFRAAGLAVFGHTKVATAIESSKEFAKRLMEKYGIPTASYQAFSDYDEALAYVSARPFPAVLKYDGLAAGKGVVIAQDLEEAKAALASMLLDEAFGKGRVVVEDFLTGPEFSFLCFVDGKRVYPMPLSQDHKRAFDGDKGPNTGGMGAYTGLPFITEEDREFAYKEIMCKAAEAMVAEGCPLSGVLYGGLMKTPQGIKVIEFNARFGDRRRKSSCRSSRATSTTSSRRSHWAGKRPNRSGARDSPWASSWPPRAIRAPTRRASPSTTWNRSMRTWRTWVPPSRTASSSPTVAAS